IEGVVRLARGRQDDVAVVILAKWATHGFPDDGVPVRRRRGTGSVGHRTASPAFGLSFEAASITRRPQGSRGVCWLPVATSGPLVSSGLANRRAACSTSLPR